MDLRAGWVTVPLESWGLAPRVLFATLVTACGDFGILDDIGMIARPGGVPRGPTPATPARDGPGRDVGPIPPDHSHIRSFRSGKDASILERVAVMSTDADAARE